MPSKITPCLWFDSQAEEAANFYLAIFKDGKITDISHYGEAGREQHGQVPGTVMMVAFEIAGQAFTALNGGPIFQFTPAVSFQIECVSQKEVDHYWEQLSAGGEKQQCGWLKDKFGVSWQLVPSGLNDLLRDPESANSQRAMTAMMQMEKPDMEALRRAYEGS